jgi:peptide-methionine (R)-S-oxide reductase
MFPVKKSESEWRAQLSPAQFAILRSSRTEPAGTSNFQNKEPGIYHCVGCDSPLYKSNEKFDSGCGWPSFYEEIPGSIKLFEDNSLGMQRTEMKCATCGGHLGHVFKGEGFGGDKDERHCVNGIILKFKPEGKDGM